MAIQFTSVKCPECGANLPIEEGRDQIFCSYCGTKVIVTNDNEHIFRHIDEAGIMQAETDRMVRMRELEIAEEKHAIRKKLVIIWILATFMMLIVSIILLIHPNPDFGLTGLLILELTVGLAIGGGVLLFKVLPEKENEKAMIRNGGIRFPKGLEPFSENNFEIVHNSLQGAGFTNISCVNLHDVTLGIFQKPGKIEKIVVDGKEITSGGKVYMPNVAISITYHGR